MPQSQPRTRCTIEILNVLGEVVPILDEGASISPGHGRTPTREYWTEEEDLIYVYREVISAPDGSQSKIERPGGVHGNIGYELLLHEKTGRAVLRLDYFTVLPSESAGQLSLEYEPKSVTISGALTRGAGLRLDVELQAGFSEDHGRPDFKTLRLTCR